MFDYITKESKLYKVGVGVPVEFDPVNIYSINRPGQITFKPRGDMSFIKGRRYPFSDDSLLKLKYAYPDLQLLFYAASQLYPLIISYTYRTCAQQAKIIACHKKATNAGPGQSWHNVWPSVAVDFVPLNRYTKVPAKDYLSQVRSQGSIITVGEIIFGQDFFAGGMDWHNDYDVEKAKTYSKNHFIDAPHIEIRDIYREQLRQQEGITRPTCAKWKAKFPNWDNCQMYGPTSKGKYQVYDVWQLPPGMTQQY